MEYGFYPLMWLFFPIIFMGITFMMVTNRLAIVTGMPTIHAIRKGGISAAAPESAAQPAASRENPDELPEL